MKNRFKLSEPEGFLGPCVPESHDEKVNHEHFDDDRDCRKSLDSIEAGCLPE